MACYLFLITMGKKGCSIDTCYNMNKTIFNEKNPYRKGHPDPIFTKFALNPSSLSNSLKNLSNTLKKKKDEEKDGKKRYIHTIEQLLKGKWGCG